MKFLTILFFSILLPLQLICQCGSGTTVILRTQTSVNNFIANHCSDFLGILAIADNNDGIDNITNLGSLSTLTSINKSFSISNNNTLTSLAGLNALTTIGEPLLITGNSILIDLTALSALTSLGSFLRISSNPSLASLSGLDNIESIESLFASISDIEISDNPLLTTCAIASICEALSLSLPTTSTDIHDNGINCNSNIEIRAVCHDPKAFITTWQTTTPNESITIPTTGNGYNYTVVWGDGDVIYGRTANATHTFATSGIHTIAIFGNFPRIYFNNNGDKDKIISIDQWGSERYWISMNNAFHGCTNLAGQASDVPLLDVVTSLSFMFHGASNFNQAIGNWNTENVTNVSYMFKGATSFNQPISLWNTDNFSSTSHMFENASSFNQNIGAWNMSNVFFMEFMFYNAITFNQDLSSWNVSQAFDMSFIFENVTLSTTHYDAMLIAWANQSLINGLNFSAGNSKYCTGTAARVSIINNFNWIITDGGIDPLCPPLPITWSSPLTAVLKTHTTILNWSVSQQFNNDKFVIEHSINGINFSLIGEISGEIASDKEIKYSYQHLNPIKGRNYYRVKQIDIDGSFSYSNIAIANLANIEEEILLYPNPASELITITLPPNLGLFKVTLINSSGQRVYYSNYIDSRYPTFNLDLSDFSKGFYILKIETSRNVFSQKLLIR